MDTPNTNSAPDAISFGDLQKLADSAPQETTPTKGDGPFDGMNEEQVMELVEKSILSAEAECEHPMYAKAMIVSLIDKLIEWHSRTALNLSEDGEHTPAVGWARDAGKLQAVANILYTISVCREDFMTN
jgi:hypothetical protein